MTTDEAIKILKGAVKKPNSEDGYLGQAITMAIKALEKQQWIPCSERLPDEEFVEGLEIGTVYDLYPLLVTRYATHSPVDPKRLYVAKHYYDGNDFVNNGGEECTEAVIAWMPLPEPYRKGEK